MEAAKPILPLSGDVYAGRDACNAFAEEIFGVRAPLGVCPTPGDLAYLRNHGETFADPGTYGQERGAQRQCWANAYRVLDADASLTYVQGFVCGSDGLIYPHAWCVDLHDRLVEVTWDCEKATGEERYFGVRFTRFQLAALIVHYRTFDWYEGFSSVLLYNGPNRDLGGRDARQ